VLETGEPLVWEWTETIDGRAYMVYDYPFHDMDGTPLALELGIDISDQKAMLDELRKFKFILDGSGEEFYMLGADGSILYANEAVSKSLGYSHEELMRMNITEVARWVDRDHWREMFEGFRLGDMPPFETVHTAKDGREIPKEVNSAFLNIAGREQVCSFARDISERKRQEQERNDFLAMVSHDIRSPMTTVIGLADLISNTKRGTLDADTLDMVGDIEKGGRKVIKLVENFVTIARLETGNLPLKPFPVSLDKLVSECVAEFANRAEAKSISLVVDTEEGLPRLEMDRHLVERALGNLVGNAINYSPGGGRVTVGAKIREEDGVRVAEIYVSDNGPGIPPEDHALAFEKYRRLKSAGGVKGSGLGLPIVKAVAEAHGGRVELVSEEGKGARFAVLIPYRKDQPAC
jgi:PAS domain S-box-containing protein